MNGTFRRLCFLIPDSSTEYANINIWCCRKNSKSSIYLLRSEVDQEKRFSVLRKTSRNRDIDLTKAQAPSPLYKQVHFRSSTCMLSECRKLQPTHHCMNAIQLTVKHQGNCRLISTLRKYNFPISEPHKVA